MTLRTTAIACSTAFALAAVLAGCGSTGSPATLAVPTSGFASPSPAGSTGSGSTSTPAPNIAEQVALTVSDLPSALSAYVQVSDGLLGVTPNTDSRVFANSGNTTRVEIDIAAGATNDGSGGYPAYQGAAAKQIVTQSATSTPSIGQMANEYVGADANNRSAVSISFVEGRNVVVVTMVSSSSTVDPTVVEAVARAEDNKITTNS